MEFQPPTSPQDIPLATYLLVLFISFWGGLVNFLHKLKRFKYRKAKTSSLLIDLSVDLIISGFSGLVVFWICMWKGVDPLLSAPITGIAGHLGSRTIFLLEKVLETKAKNYVEVDFSDEDDKS